MPSYAIQLAQDLVRCPSVTPAEGGALDLMQGELCKLGFNCTRLPFGRGVARIDNLLRGVVLAGRILLLPAIQMLFRREILTNGSTIHLAVFYLTVNCLAEALQT